MQHKRIPVTGGAGFIGSNFANTLAEDNHIIALDDGYLGTPENLDDDVEFHEASVLDGDTDGAETIDTPEIGVLEPVVANAATQLFTYTSRS